MTLIDASGIKKGSEDAASNVVPYNELRTSWKRDDAYYNWYAKHLQEIHADETDPERGETDEVYEDLFITLDDPYGAADDVASVLISKYNRLDAIITSIQNGEDEDEIFHQLDNGEAYCVDTTDRIEQANGLFSSALTLYQFLYNNPEIEEEYGDTTDREKLVRVLAVAERKAQRKIIATYRDEFGKYLSSPHYKQHFVDFLEGGVQELFEGKDILPTHLATLAVQPHDKDRHLDLKVDYEGGDDPWAWFFKEVTAAGSVFDEVLSKSIDLDEVKQSILDGKVGFKLSRRFIKCLNTSLKALAKYVVREEKVTLLLKYVKAFSYRNQPVLQVRTAEINSKLKGGLTLDLNKMIERERLVANKRGRVGTDRVRIRTGRTMDYTKAVAVGKEVEVMAHAQGYESERMLHSVLKHPKFIAFLAGLELVNACSNLRKFTKENSLKNSIGLFGSAAHLSSASSAYVEAKIAQGVYNVSEGSSLRITKFSKVAGFVGSGVSVAMCTWDSVDRFQSRDYDASLVWGLTGVVSGILWVDGVFAYAGGAALLGFWPTLILSALFFGGMFLAIYLTDNPIEKYLKNNAFNSTDQMRLSPETPFYYIRAMIDNKARLVPDRFKIWRDFQRAASDLYDLLIAYKVDDDIVSYHKRKLPGGGPYGS